jgi:hypothetical protein
MNTNKRIISSLELGPEKISLMVVNDSLYVIERFYNKQMTVSCDFPLSMSVEAREFYDSLVTNILINEETSGGTDGTIH